MSRISVNVCRPSAVKASYFQSRRIRGLVEVIIAVAALGAVIAIAADKYTHHLNKATVTSSLHSAKVIKDFMTKAYYDTGVWHSDDLKEIGESVTSAPVESVEYVEGGFTMVIALKRESFHLTLRAAESENSVRAPMLWLCGYADVPDGYRVFADNNTDVPKMYLPRECKGIEYAK